MTKFKYSVSFYNKDSILPTEVVFYDLDLFLDFLHKLLLDDSLLYKFTIERFF